MAEFKVHLKLLINTKSKRVLFAEAGKDFVDFLFHILAMPFATATMLLGKQEMVGGLGKLYESLENLDHSYLLEGTNKDTLLKPKTLNPLTSLPLMLLADNQKTFYVCSSCYQESHSGYSYSSSSYRNRQYNFSDEPNTPWPTCSKQMTRILTYVAPPPKKGVSTEGGYVKGLVTYMIMDDLVVKPMSTISSVALLNQFNVKEFSVLQEKEVDIGMNEALMVLKASLHSNNVLTTVFYEDECKIETKSVTSARKKASKL